MQILVDLVSKSEPNSRLLRAALVCLTNLSCHKDNRVAMMRMGLADLLVTLTLTATPDSKHLEAALIMLVNMSSIQACRLAMVRGGSAEAAVAVIRACEGGVGQRKNHQIALQIVQNLSADANTGETLIAQGGLGVALSSARNSDAKVSAVAAGVLSNLALYGRQNGGKVCRILVEHGALDALQGLVALPERTGLSAAKAAAYLFGIPSGVESSAAAFGLVGVEADRASSLGADRSRAAGVVGSTEGESGNDQQEAHASGAIAASSASPRATTRSFLYGREEGDVSALTEAALGAAASSAGENVDMTQNVSGRVGTDRGPQGHHAEAWSCNSCAVADTGETDDRSPEQKWRFAREKEAEDGRMAEPQLGLDHPLLVSCGG